MAANSSSIPKTILNLPKEEGKKCDYQVTFSDGLMMTLFEFFCKFVLFCSSEMKKNENKKKWDSVLVQIGYDYMDGEWEGENKAFAFQNGRVTLPYEVDVFSPIRSDIKFNSS